MIITGARRFVAPATFFAEILDIKGFALKISVKNVKEFIVGAYCSKKGPSQYEICLGTKKRNRDFKEGRMEMLAHEMVHIKQFHTGQMKDIFDGDVWWVRWEGKDYRFPDTASQEYWSSPWEVEARQKQAELARAWRDVNEL